MNYKNMAQKIWKKLFEIIVIAVFGAIIAFAKGLSAFEILFPGNPPGSSRGDDES